jgi:hypothetical protein
MGSFSNYLENELLDHLTGVGSYSAPATVYVALSTADPTEDGSALAEPTGNNYSRASVTNSGTNWDTASGGATANKTAITFATASGDWGTITHYAVMDAATSGNMLWYGTLTTSKTVGNGDTPKFNIGDLDLTLT